MPNHKSQIGFTLIELMVVITIIGVVFGVVISSANQIKKNARDAQRKSDLAKIQGALQSYYTDQSFYPPNGQVNPGGQLSYTNPNNNTTTYLTPIPSDPVSGNPNYYYIAYKDASGLNYYCVNTDSSPSNRCNYYQLYTKLENNTGVNYPVGVSGSNYNYYVVTP